ncbi:unnamed protein product [Pedinophyceae sp. YPF-701]|nr:unnamed protein product [Pedinophyceae sp. YPF-701]
MCDVEDRAAMGAAAQGDSLDPARSASFPAAPPLEDAASGLALGRPATPTIDVSRLENGSELGEGAFARVKMYDYVDAEGLSVKVAMKMLRRNSVRSLRGMQREKLLATLLTQLGGHDHIVMAYPLDVPGPDDAAGVKSGSVRRIICEGVGGAEDDLGEEGPSVRSQGQDAIMAQEYVPGGNLRDLILRQREARLQGAEPAYTPATALGVLADAAQGIAFLHGCEPMIIHRDVKPENILLLDEDTHGAPGGRIRAKICDFGLCAFVDRSGRVDGGAAVLGSDLNSRRGSSEVAPALERHRALTQARGGCSQCSGESVARATVPGRLEQGSVTSQHVPQNPSRFAPSCTERMMQHTPPAQPPPRTGGTDVELRSGEGGSATRALPPQTSTVDLAAEAEGGTSWPGKHADGPGEARGLLCLTGSTGTVPYIAPENFAGGEYDEKCDVFSLALVMYEVMTGDVLSRKYHLERSALSGREFMQRLSQGWRPPLPADPAWPAEALAVMQRAWAPAPQDRPSMHEVACALQEAAGRAGPGGAGPKAARVKRTQSAKSRKGKCAVS